MKREFNQLILDLSPKHRVSDLAPSTEVDLFSGPRRELVIWSGSSDRTIWADERVNWAFRAWHDALHLKTGLSFGPDAEIELGRLQAASVESRSSLLADLVYCEVSLQAKHFKDTGLFVADQVAFTINALKQGIRR